MSDSSDTRPLLLKVEVVAQMLSISRGRAYDLIRDGTIPSIKIGAKTVRVPRHLLDDYLASLTNTETDQ